MSKRKRQPPPDPAPVDPTSVDPAASPATVFDELCARHADTLVRQAFLLTGRPRLARRAVVRAFQLAWQRWPEVAADADPAGWVRAVAYEHALAPWHRFRPRRPLAAKGATPEDRALLRAFLELPASYRRTLLLHDGVGLGLYETAAEVEASSRAAAGRLMHARERLAQRLPELGLAGRSPVRQGEMLRVRLGELAAAQEVRVPAPRAVRTKGTRTARWTTGAAIGLTGLVAAATAVTVLTAPDRYAPPPQRPAATSGPQPGAPGDVSDGSDDRARPEASGAEPDAVSTPSAGPRKGRGARFAPAEARLTPALR
ncbi:hypothetical protein [Streptomyces natalensis]|uniref:RNA polymerase sigma factor 70 region 4 type 2 domain-containing protein n=1 Tax=Streptomyces natalensis ATCC 27448 TaxID=1240678 RepID=A0A0D7CER5_9ACTN|nr:hypothetical protein [Streptomyces natalensis]KIZ14561.1 hypothetical protein SNA_36505 [Streptomyces natalensis ATCC 27448]